MKLDKHPEAKALIFDLDGTLSNSIPVHIATWEAVCHQYSCSFDPSMVAELTGQPTIVFANRIINQNNLQNVNPLEMVKLKQQIFNKSIEHLQGHEPVIKLAHHYYGKIPMAVGTGANARSAELQLRTLGIYDMMDHLITADDVTEHKPAPMTFLACAEKMNIEPKYCHVFEDGVLGIEAAKAAGMFVTDVRPYLKNSNCK